MVDAWKWNLYIVKTKSKYKDGPNGTGVVFLKFESIEKIEKYANNPILTECSIVKSFENMEFSQYCDYWHNKSINELLSL